MKDKKECSIVRDLLPNYIENLTNEETNKMIEKHLEECEDCKKILEEMKKDLNLPEEKRNKKEVKFMKKYNRKLRILKCIVAIILLIFVFHVVRNIVIIVSLSNKIKNSSVIDYDNYYIKAVSYDTGSCAMTITETYYKDGNILEKVTSLYDEGYVDINSNYYLLDEESGMLVYHYYYESYAYANYAGIGSTNTKDAYIDDEYETKMNPLVDELMFASFVPTEYSDGNVVFITILESLLTTIKDTGNSYKISDLVGLEYEEYYDKDTGLITREIGNDESEIITDYTISFGNVKDSVFVEPDLDDYTIYTFND